MRSKNFAGKALLHPSLFLESSHQAGRWRSEPVFAAELPPSTGTGNVQLVPATMRASDDPASPIIDTGSYGPPMPIRQDALQVKYLVHRGRLLFIGDHIVVRGDDGQIYFAVLRDFWMTPTNCKYFTLQWLLPKPSSAANIDGPQEGLDPILFLLGPLHERAEPVDAIIDVFYSPLASRKPIEGPTPLASKTATPGLEGRRSVCYDDSILGKKIFKSPLYASLGASASGNMTPSPSAEGIAETRCHSDTEIDYRQSREILSKASSILLEPLTSPIKSSLSSHNILEDVEMAHLLCSMV